MPRNSACGPFTRRTRNSVGWPVAQLHHRLAEEESAIVLLLKMPGVFAIGHVALRRRPANGIVHADTIGAYQRDIINLRQALRPAAQKLVHVRRAKNAAKCLRRGNAKRADPLLNLAQHNVHRLHGAAGLLRQHDRQIVCAAHGLGEGVFPQVPHDHADRHDDTGQQAHAGTHQRHVLPD